MGQRRLDSRGNRAWIQSYLLFGIGPAGDLHDHVQNGLLLVGIQRDVMEGRDGDAIPLDEDTILECVRLANPADGVFGPGLCVGHGWKLGGGNGREMSRQEGRTV